MNDKLLKIEIHEAFNEIIKRYYQEIEKKELPPISIVREFKTELAKTALFICGNNYTQAARLLSINRTTLMEMTKSRFF